MARSDLDAILAPWLDRWSVSDRSHVDTWTSQMQLCTWDAGQTLIKAGERSDSLYLIESGLVRLFYLSPEGKERNKAFYRAGDVTGPVSAVLSHSAAPFTIEAMEATTAVCFVHRHLLAAAEANLEIYRLYTRLLAHAFMRNEEREALLLTCNAQQRYQWLLESDPELIDRVPQFHLASYLGLDPVSLSRVKAKSKT